MVQMEASPRVNALIAAHISARIRLTPPISPHPSLEDSECPDVRRLEASGIGPVTAADIEFGELTVFVGPQATGKSIFLQILKLLLDKYAIHQELRRFGIDWRGDPRDFLELYFGEGMSGIWNPEESGLVVDGEEVDLPDYAQRPTIAERGEALLHPGAAGAEPS